MKILDELLAMRKYLEERDYKEAMTALMRRIHYDVAPRVTSGDTFTLFSSELEMNAFCQKQGVYMCGLKHLLDMMREEGLIMQDTLPITLTQLGVEKLCR